MCRKAEIWPTSLRHMCRVLYPRQESVKKSLLNTITHGVTCCDEIALNFEKWGKYSINVHN
jgi:hypothetical protein